MTRSYNILGIFVGLSIVTLIIWILLVDIKYGDQDSQYRWLANHVPRVVVSIMTSEDPWQAFLDEGRSTVRLQVKDQTTGTINYPIVIAMNHPWCKQWSFSDQMALGSLPRELTNNLKIISHRCPWYNPRQMLLEKLGSTRVGFIKNGNKGQFDQVKTFVQTIINEKAALLVYPEGYYSKVYQYRDSPPLLAPFRSGIFVICHDLQVPILPVVLPLHWRPSLKDRPLDMFILPVIHPSSYTSASDFQTAVFNAMSAKLEEQETINRR